MHCNHDVHTNILSTLLLSPASRNQFLLQFMCEIELSIEILDQLDEILNLLHFSNNTTCSMKFQLLTKKEGTACACLHLYIVTLPWKVAGYPSRMGIVQRCMQSRNNAD